MTFFPDLSPYRYSKLEGWRLDLNVGWLSRNHEFTRGPAPAGFVEALLMCAMRPIRLCRGLHECDLCPGAITNMDLGGRLVHLGNGEIRVTGSDRRMYAAPTLVAHYVHHHGYLPPAPFIDGVMALADTL